MSRRLLVTAICVLVLCGLATLQGALLALAIPWVVYLGAGLLRRPAPLQLHVARQLSASRVSAGDLVEVSLQVTNHGAGLEELLVEDVLPQGLELVEGASRLIAPCAAGASLALRYTLRARRGAYRLAQVRLLAREPLGLFQQQTVVQAPGQLLVLPQVQRLRQIAIQPRRTRLYPGLIAARQGGSGLTFFDVRQYQPGDSLRLVNTRASARQQEDLLVNEFEQERVADVGLILDARRQADLRAGDEALFEQAVLATAALADHFLSRGNRVALLIYGQTLNWTMPGYGKLQRERILHALAWAEQGDHVIFEHLEALPTRLFPAGSQLVLVSTLLLRDVPALARLRARGYGTLVFSPDPIAFEAGWLAATPATQLAARIARLEREVILRRLRQIGVRVINWQTDRPLQAAAEAALRAPLRERLPARGPA